MEPSQPPKLPSTWSGWGLALGTRLHRSPLIAFWGGGSLYYRVDVLVPTSHQVQLPLP